MPSTSKKGSGTKTVFTLLLMGAVAFGAMAAYVKLSPPAQHVDREIPIARQIDSVPHAAASTSGDAAPTRDPSGVSSSQLRSAVISGDDVSLGQSTVSIPDGQEPAVFLANEALKAVHSDSAHATGVQIKNRVAMISFTSDIQNGFGSTQEANFLKALQVSLGQIPGIDKFQILVDGQPIESLGHIDLTEAQDVIRPTPAKP